MSSKSITIGQYISGETFLHYLDSRAKLLALFLFIAAIFFVNVIWGFIPFLILLVFLYQLVQVPFRFFWRGIRPIIYISLLTLILHFFFTKGGEVLLNFDIVTIEYAGVEMGLFTFFRLLLLVFFTMIVTLTTTPLSLAGGLEYFLRPLRFLKVPVSEIAMILTIAIRFIPTLTEESERIIKAQMARGANFAEGNIFNKIRFLAPVVVPLFVSAFRRADDLALAMESRGYRAGVERTRMRENHFKTGDFAAIAFSIIVVLLVFVGRSFLNA